jgi:ADP-ribosylglycohydrolase
VIDKFQASLLGFAIGDALASPIEDVIPDYVQGGQRVLTYTKAAPSHPLVHLEPGQYSDETQTMLILAESLVQTKGFHIDDVAHRFVDWFQTQKFRSAWRFPGNTTMKACRKLTSGTPWNQAGFPSAGIGACVRTVPLCLAFWRSPTLLRDSLEKSCRITHTDTKVLASSMVLATAIRMGLEGSEPAADVLVNSAIEKAQVYSTEIVRKLKTMKDCLRMETPAALANIGTSGFCFEAVCAALFLFLRSPKRFDDLIIEAANVGGDSDAIAAMAGAMFGAFNGLAVISEKWIRPLEQSERIKQLGCDLYRLATPQR